MSSAGVPLIILAGGRATRLGALSRELPKFLMPIDGPALRFADVQLEWASRQGFTEVMLSVGYRGDEIRAYCGSGGRFGLSLTYVEDGPLPLGTGGAALKALRASAAPWAALLYGDTLLDFDAPRAVEHARASGAQALMTWLREAPEGHSANASPLGGGKLAYSKRAPLASWRGIDYGFLVLRQDSLAAFDRPGSWDLGVALETLSAAGQLEGFEVTRPFREINTPESLSAFVRWYRGTRGSPT